MVCGAFISARKLTDLNLHSLLAIKLAIKLAKN
jgi:hypothetical protein